MATTTTPRLKTKYREEIAGKLRDEFKYENVMQIPGLVKIVVNMGVGDAARDSKLMDGAVRDLTTITAKEPLGKGHFHVHASLSADGNVKLLVNDTEVAKGKAPGAIPQQPRAALFVGQSGPNAVADYETSSTFPGKVTDVRVLTDSPK